MSSNVLITGITGQDGAILAKQLVDQGYNVFGTYRRTSSPNFWRLAYLGIDRMVNLVPCDILDFSSVYYTVKAVKPFVIYHLAAQSQVLTSFNSPIVTGQTTGMSVTYFLEAIRQIDRTIKFYNAASSELFGNTGSDGKFNEDTKFSPESPYAVAKLFGYWMTKVYRGSHKVFAVNGILFNHESEIRGLEFVTRKITNEASKISLKISNNITLGNIKASRDWGYAPEYTTAIQQMMMIDEPDDYVVATGETHTVEEFLSLTFKYLDLDYRDFLVISDQFKRPTDVNYLKGDHSKLSRKTGWKPSIRIRDLIARMVDADKKRWEDLLNGKIIPSDALFYDENKLNFFSYEVSHDPDL